MELASCRQTTCPIVRGGLLLLVTFALASPPVSAQDDTERPSASSSSVPYKWPLVTGDRWIYRRGVVSPHSDSLELTTARCYSERLVCGQTRDGRAVVVNQLFRSRAHFTGTVGPFHREGLSWTLVGENDGFVVEEAEPSINAYPLVPSLVTNPRTAVVPIAPTPSRSWESNAGPKSAPQGSLFGGSVTIAARPEPLTTSAGTFSAWRVDGNTESGTRVTAWYTAGVGLLRRDVELQVGSHTLVDRTDLLHYSLSSASGGPWPHEYRLTSMRLAVRVLSYIATAQGLFRGSRSDSSPAYASSLAELVSEGVLPPHVTAVPGYDFRVTRNGADAWAATAVPVREEDHLPSLVVDKSGEVRVAANAPEPESLPIPK